MGRIGKIFLDFSSFFRLTSDFFLLLFLLKKIPLAAFDFAVFPGKARFIDGLSPSFVSLIQAFPPRIHTRAQFPSAADYSSQTSIAPSDKILHCRNPHISVIHLDAPHPPKFSLQQFLLAGKLSSRNRVPLKGSVRLRRKIRNCQVKIQSPPTIESARSEERLSRN